MFKDSMQGVSTLSFSLFSSVKDMIQKNTFESTADSSIQFINELGDIYIPYSRKFGPKESGDNKIPRFAPEGDGGKRFESPVYYQDFKRHYIDPNVTTINYNPSICLPTLLKQLSESPDVYGVVLQKKVGRKSFDINPLHPMVSFLIMSGLMELPDEGKLHVFEYNSSGKAKTANALESTQGKRLTKSYMKDYEKFFAISGDIMRDPVKISQNASMRDSEISALIEDPFIENIQDITVNIKKNSDDQNLSSIRSLLIPNQLIMDGTVGPYYGISSITDPVNSRITGYGLGPMVTGNISMSHNDGRRSYNSFLGSADESNVCTGSETSTVPKGWFTLSKVNLNSMYYSDVIDSENVFAFIEASKKVSNDIWTVYDQQAKDKLAAALVDTEAEAPEAEAVA